MNELKNSKTLNKKFKSKWLTALRSGKYKQGTGELKAAGKQEFCCLGVACDIAGIQRSKFAGTGMTTDLSLTIQTKLPPFFRSGKVVNPHLATLADMNDSGKSFAQIAAHIEKKY